MKLVGVLMALAAAVSAACTKANPRSCKDGSCTDPSLPFCDTTGAIAGDPQTCIAPVCTPGELAECRGSTAVTCNATGNDYDLVDCGARGCDESSGGCTRISCQAGSFKECQGDSEIVCNATGDDYGVIACEHGCDDASGCKGISCSANTFSSCQGDDAISCNAAGNNYLLEHCDHGCDPLSGCKECDANTATCSNATLTSCDSNGHATAPTTCDLGCATSAPRCKVMVPSNNVGVFADTVTNPPTQQLVNPVFNTGDGTVTVTGNPIAVPTTLLAAGPNGVALRVFVFDNLEITNASFVTTGNPLDAPGPAAAIVAKRDLVVHGGLTVQARVGQAGTGCSAGDGFFMPDGGQFYATGGGGGGNATTGATGGFAQLISLPGGGAGGMIGAPTLVPLQGGCAGGIDQAAAGAAQRNGGGALQLTSYTHVQLEGLVGLTGSDGAVVASMAMTQMYAIGGGGSGGSLLVEAPEVTLAATANIATHGGAGGACTPTGTTLCTPAGAGATSSTMATSGGDDAIPSGRTFRHTGGGGGGLGRLRINTATGQYVSAGGAVVDATATMGTVSAQ